MGARVGRKAGVGQNQLFTVNVADGRFQIQQQSFRALRLKDRL